VLHVVLVTLCISLRTVFMSLDRDDELSAPFGNKIHDVSPVSLFLTHLFLHQFFLFHHSARPRLPHLQVDSAFHPPLDGKMGTNQRAVMLCGWGVKAGMA